MTQWRVAHGEILDSDAEGLICSANPSLNLSGGVGGAFIMRFGPAMQEYLHEHLRNFGRKYVKPGHSVLAPPCGSKFKGVAHAVAIDAFYDTNIEYIRNSYSIALHSLADAGCRTIAAACLACGYGRCSIATFIESIEPLIHQPVAGIEAVTFITTNSELVEELNRAFGS